MICDRIVATFRNTDTTATIVIPRREILVRVHFAIDPALIQGGGVWFVALGSWTGQMYGDVFQVGNLLAHHFFESHQTIAGNQGTVSENFVVEVGYPLERNNVLTLGFPNATSYTSAIICYFAKALPRAFNPAYALAYG